MMYIPVYLEIKESGGSRAVQLYVIQTMTGEMISKYVYLLGYQ